MAFETDTATDAEDLMSRFRTFITSNVDLAAEVPSQVWVEEKFTSTPGVESELYLRGPGLGAADQIHVNINLFNDTTAGSDAWSWRIKGATSFNTGLTFDNQPGTSATDKVMPTFDASMPYWFFANGRRFIIIAQVTTSVYVDCYCGFLLPFAPAVAALEYIYPMYIGASMGQVGLRFSSTSTTRHRSFWNPGIAVGNVSGTASVYTPGNAWQEFSNVTNTGVKDVGISANHIFGLTDPYSTMSSGVATPGTVENQELMLGGDYLLTDVLTCYPRLHDESGADTYGILDGVAHITGISNSSQNTVAVGADTYFVVQEASRTGQGDYVAIKQ